MAAIDKLFVEDYYSKEELVIWCIKHKPSLLENIYIPFGSSATGWYETQAKREGNVKIPIANFSLKQDKYLYWHCPLDFVREYLHKQCGYKDNWFVKLFWRR